MYPLSQTLARERMLYASPMIAAPSVMLIDMPVRHRGEGLALGRYYAIILETDEERGELDRFLDEPRPAVIAPDLLDTRPSSVVSDHVIISRYEPPADGWPWVLVCRWPEPYARIASDSPGCDMARDCYTMEVFEHLDDLKEHSAALLEQLGTHGQLKIRMLTPGSSLTGTA
ncbi:hypothetical protein [Sphingomonas sp. TDK1]|uniref:hypothetical protein n=1 Tax=Sphingomonas sp. TDK1 TaxID=453247 RepID=UPI000A02E74B|nr:hypothetical protein [Sphingomonas sp. TDK1]